MTDKQINKFSDLTFTKFLGYDLVATFNNNAEIRKLKQTLAEIKEIADKDFRHTAWEEYAKQLKQILQKISEVENGFHS